MSVNKTFSPRNTYSRTSYVPRSPRSPMSPRLKPPEANVPQSKIDNVHGTFASLSNSKLTSLPPTATSPALLVADLEGNCLKSSDLNRLPKKLTTLNLVSNPLGDMKIPLLKQLRSLSIDNCGLTSFKGLPSFPQLRYLSVTNNKISSFKFFPPLLKLEYFDIQGNAFNFSKKLSIAAIGSICMTTFNGVELTDKDLIEAFQLSPLVGYSLRMGRDPQPCATPEEEIRKTQDFLTAKLAQHIASKGLEPVLMNLNVCNINHEPSLMCPIESPSIKWYKSRSPDRGSEWVEIPQPDKKKQNNILPLTMQLRMHLVKCEFVLDGQTFVIFTDYPIGHDQQDLSLPFPLDPIIAGEPIEGSLISLIPLPIPARAAWLRKTTTIAENVTSIILTKDEINFVITCLLQPYCPNYPRVSFATVYVETEKVDPIIPTVSGVSFPNNIVEGVKITFTRKMFPEREGESQILIERARGITEEWLLVAELKPDDLSYVPSCDDSGHYLRLSYAPVTAEGVVGKTVYFYSSTRVLPTLPVFTNAVIGGLPKTNFTLCAVADYKGGRRGHCSYNWYFSSVPVTMANIKSLKLVARDTQVFTIPEDYKDCYVACEMVPVREDEVVGDAVYAALTEPIIEDEPPEVLPYELPSVITNGTELKFNEQVQFYISSTRGFCGFTEVKRGTSLTIRDRWVGRVLRLVTSNSDVVVGEIQLAPPVIEKVTIKCAKYEHGETATLDIKAKALRPDHFEVMWIRCCGDIEKCVAFNTPNYTFQAFDIGFQIKARVTAFDDNLIYFDPVESEMTTTIKSGKLQAPLIIGNLTEKETLRVKYRKEFDQVKWLRSDVKEIWVETGVTTPEYTITTQDIGHYLRAQITVGESVLIATTSYVCQALPPIGYVIFDTQEAREGETLIPKLTYRGGIEGKSLTIWQRFETGRMENGTLSADNWKDISTEQQYKVTKDDVGFRLRFVYTPIRNDKVEGKKITHDFGRVLGLEPTVTNVKVKQNEHGYIECTGDYIGGKQGPSFYIWHVDDKNGKPRNIRKTYENYLVPPANIFGLPVYATYYPVRDDGYEGDPVRSENNVVVQPLPTVTSVDLLVKDGVVRVGQVMRCKAKCSEGATPKFQWYRVNPMDQNDRILLEKETKCDYTPKPEDLGYYLLCLVNAVNQSGWKGNGVSVATAAPVDYADIVLEIVPQTNKLSKKEMYWTGARLTTNFPEEIVSWERESKDTKEWLVLGDYNSYPISVNDIGCRLRAAIGQYETKPSPIITINPEVGSFVNAHLRSKHLSFKAKAASGSTTWEFHCDQNGITMKSKRAGGHEKKAPWSSVKINGVDNTPDQLILWMDAATKFQIIPALKGDSRFKAIVIKNSRDFIVYTLQQFIAKYSQ